MGLKSSNIDYGTDGAGELDERLNPLWHASKRTWDNSNGGGGGLSGSPSGQSIANSNARKSLPPPQNISNSGAGENTSSEPNNSDIPQELVAEMQARGLKFKKEELKFVTHDQSGQLIWLGQGNARAGLIHLVSRHANDFQQACNVNVERIPAFLKIIVSKGKIIENKVSIVNGRTQFARKYDYGGKHYILTAIGDNGFIVTAYPINERGDK